MPAIQDKIAATERHMEMLAGRLKALKQKSREQKKRLVCRGCKNELPTTGPGRPRVWCEKCKNSEPFKKWFRERYGERLKNYQREYRREYRKRQRELSDKMKYEAENL